LNYFAQAMNASENSTERLAAYSRRAAEQKMSLVDLTKTAAFSALTAKQGIFVLEFLKHYLATGTFDATAATQEAYECKSKDHARVFSYQLIAHPRIRLAIHSYLEDSPAIASMKMERQLLIDEVTKAIRHAEPGSVAHSKLLVQKERLLFGIKAGRLEVEEDSQPVEAEVAEPIAAPDLVKGMKGMKVGDTVKVRGLAYRVTEVDAEGKPLAGDVVEEKSA
jgi:hypothetical protein